MWSPAAAARGVRAIGLITHRTVRPNAPHLPHVSPPVRLRDSLLLSHWRRVRPRYRFTTERRPLMRSRVRRLKAPLTDALAGAPASFAHCCQIRCQSGFFGSLCVGSSSSNSLILFGSPGRILVDQRAHRGTSGRPPGPPIEAQIPQRIQTFRSGQRISIRYHSLEAASVTDRYGQISY
jgi:hypothetical protein